MKRLARLALAIGFAASLLAGGARKAALATPFSDVPANHWAYQYIQSLAADGVIDGYPDGMFKGDRPLTRYEMAVVVARVIAKLQENGNQGVSKEDLEKLQKLVDALKDELDGLGVRVTNLEDSLDALDKRTKFAQGLSLHGVFLPNVTFRERYIIPTTVPNTTGAAVTTYNGVSVPPGTALGNPTAVVPYSSSATSVDPFINAYLATDDSNNPFTQANSGIQIRQDSRFSLSYAVNDNLTVSLPVHILNFEYGGDFSQQSKFDIEPTIDIAIAHAGAISNLDFKFGVIDTMTSSRTGLAFRAPQGYNGAIPYEDPYQPPQKGLLVKGTIGEGTFGLTDFEGSFTRVDDTRIDTQPGAVDPSVLPLNANTYFYPIVAPQETFTQTTPAGSLKTDTFSAGTGTLTQVYLTQEAVNGSVYISFFNGASFNNAGTQIGGPTVTVPAFTFNAAFNAVVFTTPIPAGSTVSITYKGLGSSNNSSIERYMVHARINQKFKGYPGGEVGVTLTRIFDFDDEQTSGNGTNGVSLINASSADGLGLVSDSVLGLDFQAPLPIDIEGSASTQPVLFGEFADSKFTPDYTSVAAVGDTAGVIGLRLKIEKVEIAAQFQSVGANFFVGAPFRYFGNAPALFANYKGFALPDFFGFGNDVGINQQFDNQFSRLGLAGPYTTSVGVGGTAGNPNLTFGNPVFNMLRVNSPTFYSAFAPNSRGETVTINTPVRIGDFNLTARGSYQHLQEIQPDGFGGFMGGPAFAPDMPEINNVYTVGTTFTLPALQSKATFNLNGTYETLQRFDTRAFQYYPFNPATQTFDATSVLAAQAAFPIGGPFGSGSSVSYFPNYINMRHILIGANAILPLSRDLNLTGSFTTQRYGGSYGTTFTQNISERKDYYTTGLTYNIPHSNSSLSVLARHYQYNDAVVPNLNLSQNRQDINFTVRF